MRNPPVYTIESVDHALKLAVMLQHEGPLRLADVAERLVLRERGRRPRLVGYGVGLGSRSGRYLPIIAWRISGTWARSRSGAIPSTSGPRRRSSRTAESWDSSGTVTRVHPSRSG